MDGISGAEHTAGEATISESFDNIFNGHDTFINGKNVCSTSPNIQHGYDIYGPNGGMTGYSMANILGGQDFYDSHGARVAYSQDNIADGHDLYDDHSNLIASSSHNIAGAEDVYHNGQLVSTSLPSVAGIDTVINYDDPLAHIGSYVMPPLMF